MKSASLGPQESRLRIAGSSPCVFALAASMLFCAGCERLSDFFKTDRTRWLAPEAVVRAPDESQISAIRSSVSMVDTRKDLPANVTFPREGDWEYIAQDYKLGPKDVVDLRILDLYTEGMETTLRCQISESGFIDLPQLSERLRAEGLTKDQLTEAIRQAYMPDILLDPNVSVTILQRRQNMFSILGAVARPSTYEVMRKDMRILEAIAMAGGKTQTNIRYAFVIRPARAIRRAQPLAPAEARTPQELPPLPQIPATKPAAAEPPAETRPATAPATRATLPPEVEAALKELGEGLVPVPTEPATPAQSSVPLLSETAAGPATTQSTGELLPPSRSEKFIHVGDRWVRVAQDAEVAPQPSGRGARPVRPAGLAAAGKSAAPAQPSDPFGWKKSDASDMARIIAIDLHALEAGNPRMNIVIRDNDIVVVPSLEVGEYYILGEVRRPGAFSLTGRKVTVKMALAAAGNLSPLAWPENSILVRRVGDNQEQIIPLNIEKIFHGQADDLYLKPDDLIAVGTSASASFFAVVRNAFRMTYGFGFIYDRNFADPLFASPDSKRFKAW